MRVLGAHAECARCIRRIVRAGQGCTTVQANPTRERKRGKKGIPVFVRARAKRRLADTIDRAERQVSHSEACRFLLFLVFSLKGVTLMLKVNLLASVAYLLAGLFGKAEGTTWS